MRPSIPLSFIGLIACLSISVGRLRGRTCNSPDSFEELNKSDYAPVCAYIDEKGGRYQTFSNAYAACNYGGVESYTDGPCENPKFLPKF